MAQVEVFGITTSGFSWRISGLQDPWNTTYYQSAYVDISGASSSNSVTAPSSGSNLYTGTGSKSGLDQNTSYVITGRVVADNGIAYAAGSVTITTLAVRPSSFSWSYSVLTAGRDAVIDARDWNALVNRINAFRVYKGLSTYAMSGATSGWDITAEKFNQVVGALSALKQYMSNNLVPYTVAIEDICYAYYFRDIVTSLNSIS